MTTQNRHIRRKILKNNVFRRSTAFLCLIGIFAYLFPPSPPNRKKTLLDKGFFIFQCANYMRKRKKPSVKRGAKRLFRDFVCVLLMTSKSIISSIKCHNSLSFDAMRSTSPRQRCEYVFNVS